MIPIRTCLILMMLLLCQSSNAQTRQKTDIEHVTVFLSGAELYSTAKLSLPAGETEVLFTNVAGNAAQQSLTIGADAGVVVQSAKFQNDYLVQQVTTPRAKDIEDSIRTLTEEHNELSYKINTINEQLTIISNNRQVAGSNVGLSVAELQKLLDLVGTRMAALQTEKGKLEKRQAAYDVSLSKLQAQLSEERNKQLTSGGQLLVKFYTPKEVSTRVHLSYLVSNAGWTPSYDVRVDNLTDPVQLFYKANVFQNSGVKWDKVKLTLSTGNPNEGAEAPVLQPWYLAFYQPVNNDYAQNKARAQGYTNSMTSEQIEKLPSRNTSDMVSIAGGTYQERRGGEVSISGARANGSLYIVDGVEVNGTNSFPGSTTVNNYVQVDNSGINTSFDIDLTYTIPSDGKPQIVAVKRYELPATYRHYASPKQDRDAFLQARITDWESLNLLPAQTNIFYEGTYVGQGMIDLRNVKDTMNLSLGRDKKVIVKREVDQKLRSVKTIGTNVREAIAYTISVRNTRKEPVELVLFDQFPVSNDAAIEVEDQVAKDAIVDEKTGIAEWSLRVLPNTTKTLHIGYTVKYPRGRTVAGLR